MASKGVNISIMGRDFSVACPDDARDELLEAAQYLDGCMKDIQKSGKIIGSERTAIMAALNISNEFLKLQKATAHQSRAEERLAQLQNKIDDVLREAEHI